MSGQELTPYLIAYAYTQGAFPMTMDEETNEIGWFQPERRCLLPISGMHVSRSLQRVIDRSVFEVRFDTAFEAVMRSCRRPVDNWISEDIIRVYTQIHYEGWGHSVECWQDGELVGGSYGVAIGGLFCAESMFHRKTNASKVALWALINQCRELGFTVFDAQYLTSHLQSLGAFEITHAQYMLRLRRAIATETPWGLNLAKETPPKVRRGRG